MTPSAPRRPCSLVLTVLNEGAGLRGLLDSIAAQTRLPDEVVVVDGGSRDESVSILHEYAARLPLRLLVEPGANISRGRNRAIEAAAHELIAVTDAGVRLEANWLERLLAPFEGEEPPHFVAGFFLPDAQGLWEHALAMVTLPAREEMGRGRWMASSRSVAFTKTAWARVGGYPEWMRWSEDVLFDLALDGVGTRVAYAPDAIVWFRPRASLAAFARQYRNYAYGDGQGLLWPKRHAVRYATYGVVLPLMLALLARRRGLALLLLVGGGAAMCWTPLKRHWRSGRYRWQALPMLPLIRIVGDLAKMWGFPQALRQGWRNRARTRSYLAGQARRAEP